MYKLSIFFSERLETHFLLLTGVGVMGALSQRCQLVRFIRKPYGFCAICTCLRAYDAILTDIYMIFADSLLRSFHSLIRTVVSLQ